jgi:hypothetical protein
MNIFSLTFVNYFSDNIQVLNMLICRVRFLLSQLSIYKTPLKLSVKSNNPGTMKKTILIFCSFLFYTNLNAQLSAQLEQTPVMTLGVFHFSFPNLDAVKTAEEDKISVLDEPWQSEIVAIAKAIEEFRPTIIAIELNPSQQGRIDSLYNLYLSGDWELSTSETQQLGFRIARNLGFGKLYCVDDMGRHYDNILEIFSDSSRMSAFENYFLTSPYGQMKQRQAPKIESIIDELLFQNHSDQVRHGLESYFLHPFKYEETPGDFTGVDFETGRWFNRNLRIFRNVQRIERTPEDRILLIIGHGHLNLLNIYFDISPEFELVSPLPYLEKAKKL